MKRSEIQQAVSWAKAFLQENNFSLPMFAGWTPEEWKSRRKEAETIIRTMRGWDVTSFGCDDFSKMGAVLFTIRNGLPDGSAGCPYAEKLILMREGQVLPNHYHRQKTEDIINRGGGNVLIRVYNSLPDESIDTVSDVLVHCDGRSYYVPAGTQVRLTPGESIHIQQYMYHDFSVEPGTGPVLLGEVSQCNDDNTDNRFNPPAGRFPAIEEDEPPYRLLCNEYPPAES